MLTFPTPISAVAEDIFYGIACWLLFHIFFLSSANFFQNYFFQKILSGTLSEWQTVWIQIRTDILSVLIWVQTVCKGYQQTTLVAASKLIFMENKAIYLTCEIKFSLVAKAKQYHLLQCFWSFFSLLTTCL